MAWWLLGGAAGTAACSPQAPFDTGVVLDGGDTGPTSGSRTCTHSLADWRARCAAGAGGGVWLPGAAGRPACDALSGEEAPYAAVALTLAETPAIGELRFRSGPMALRRVIDLFDEMDDGVSERERAASLAVLTAFEGCDDRGILASETRTSLCDTSGFTVGVGGAECGNLDSACGRGYLDATRGCCTTSLAVEGSVCSTTTGDGACGPSGTCDAGRPRSSTGAPAWAEVIPARSAPPVLGDWHSESGRVVLRVAEVWELEARTTDEPPDYEEVGWVEVADGDGRVVASRLTRAANGVDGMLVHAERGGLRHLFIQRRLEVGDLSTVEVAVLRTSVDDMGLIAQDGTTIPAGLATRLTCTLREDQAPLASDGESSCEYDERAGLFFVRGEGLTAAWILEQGGRDIRPAGTMTPPVSSSTQLDETDHRFSDAPCSPGVVRTCTHPCGGTGYRACAGPGRGWGPCVRTERCNACDDDRDGRVDEGGNSLCDDGASCSVDSCVSLPAGGGRRQTVCVNSPRPQLCGRGRCTYGVCNGSVGSTADILPERVVPAVAGPTGCQWAEDDDWCENTLDNCVCNGYSRCDGTGVPQWTGVADPPPAFQSILFNSWAACRQRGPTESRRVLGDAGFVATPCSVDSQCGPGETCVSGPFLGFCQPIRNGGCDTDRNPCTIDSFCIEPFPEFCRLTNNPQAIQTHQTLTTDPLVSRMSGVIDGRPVTCATSVINQQIPPSPFNELCYGPDGNPCTNDIGLACNTESGVCGAPSAMLGPQETGDIIGFFVDGFGLGTLNGASCFGDPYERLSTPVGSYPPVVLAHSCYTQSCQLDTLGRPVCDVDRHDDVCVDALPGNECGGTRFCSGSPRVPGSVTQSVDVSLPGQPTLYGCRRFGDQCYSQPFDECLEAGERLITGDQEEGTDNLHCFECGTNTENLAPLPAGTECGVLDSFGNRCGVCGASGECIRTSPDLVTCGDL